MTKLTQPQQDMLLKAATDPDGTASAGLTQRKRTAYKLEDLGLGTTHFWGCLIFTINDAGRAAIEELS